MDLSGVIADVKKLMGAEASGHDYEHIERVYHLALNLAEAEGANTEIVGLAALLHDCDDYKIFGTENAEKLLNTRRILQKNQISIEQQEAVCAIINTMGYSKALKGFRPQSLEGKVVSDADMLDAIGANAIVRTLAYTLTIGNRAVFNRDIFPKKNLNAADYCRKDRAEDHFINHFFDKLLKLKAMLFCKSARKEAEIRHQFMVSFLDNYFREMECDNWREYLYHFEQK